jgi:hypothetical protein
MSFYWAVELHEPHLLLRLSVGRKQPCTPSRGRYAVCQILDTTLQQSVMGMPCISKNPVMPADDILWSTKQDEHIGHSTLKHTVITH